MAKRPIYVFTYHGSTTEAVFKTHDIRKAWHFGGTLYPTTSYGIMSPGDFGWNDQYQQAADAYERKVTDHG